MLSKGNMGALLYHYTGQVGPYLGIQGQLDGIVVIDCAAAVDAAITILSSLLMGAALPFLTVTVAMAVVDGGKVVVNNGGGKGQGLCGRGRMTAQGQVQGHKGQEGKGGQGHKGKCEG
jgi:hypothetical protein